MTVKELSTRLCYYVLGGYEVLEGGINLKVHCIDFLNHFISDTLKEADYGGSYSNCAYII
jgi:hypothetical protein